MQHSISMHSIPLQGFNKLLTNKNIWNTIKQYLEAKDIISLLNISSFKYGILQDKTLFNYLQQIIQYRIPEVVEIPKKSPVVNLEQRDINLLIEKYVTQQYIVGKQIDNRLKSTMGTLLKLQQSSDNQTLPQNKYNSAAELVMTKFPFDKTIQLLGKSTSFFAKNSNSMTD